MPIFVYSGEDIISSRKAFLSHLEDLKKDNLEVVRLSGKEVTGEVLENLLGSRTLFGQTRILAIDNFFGGPKSKEKDGLLTKIKTFKDATVLFWENKDFSKADQLKYPGFSFKNFKLPPAVFNFVDCLGPGKGAESLRFFKEAAGQTDANFIFLMLVRQIRLLIMAKDEKVLSGLPPWQRSKLARQAKAFTLQELIKIHRRLLEIDFREKTSGSPYSLQTLIEILLTEI